MELFIAGIVVCFLLFLLSLFSHKINSILIIFISIMFIFLGVGVISNDINLDSSTKTFTIDKINSSVTEYSFVNGTNSDVSLYFGLFLLLCSLYLFMLGVFSREN